MMRKILVFTIIILLAIGIFMSCDGNVAEAGNKSLSEIMDILIEEISKVETDAEIEIIDKAEVEEMPNYYLGIDDLSRVAEVIVAEAGIMDVPFSLALLRVNNRNDLNALKNEIKDNVQINKWICAFADYAYVNSYEDIILLVIGIDENVEMVNNKFQSVTGATSDTLLTRSAWG